MPVVHPSPQPITGDRPAAAPASSVIAIDNLSFAYPDGRPALRGVSLTITPGEKIALVGPNGAGKSTLMLHLNGILGGRDAPVRVDGLPPTKENLPIIRGKVGLVFQNPDDQLFTPTVEEDVAFGPLNLGCTPQETRERVQTALSQLRLEGYERRSTHELSFGEKRRVALATVLAMRPRVIGFDEPFANLDPGMVEQLVSLIRSLDATVILISQEILPAIACADRLAVVHQGRIAAAGPALDIASDRALLRRCGIDFHFYGDIWQRILTNAGAP